MVDPSTPESSLFSHAEIAHMSCDMVDAAIFELKFGTAEKPEPQRFCKDSAEALLMLQDDLADSDTCTVRSFRYEDEGLMYVAFVVEMEKAKIVHQGYTLAEAIARCWLECMQSTQRAVKRPYYIYLHTNGQLFMKPAIAVEMDPSYFDSPYVVRFWKIQCVADLENVMLYLEEHAIDF